MVMTAIMVMRRFENTQWRKAKYDTGGGDMTQQTLLIPTPQFVCTKSGKYDNVSMRRHIFSNGGCHNFFCQNCDGTILTPKLNELRLWLQEPCQSLIGERGKKLHAEINMSWSNLLFAHLTLNQNVAKSWNCPASPPTIETRRCVIVGIGGPYILKAGVQTPQTIWNFPQKDCLRMRVCTIVHCWLIQFSLL